MRALLGRLLTDDRGQDLIEYALLAAVVALASVAALEALKGSLHDAYVSWDTASQNRWAMPDP